MLWRLHPKLNDPDQYRLHVLRNAPKIHAQLSQNDKLVERLNHVDMALPV